MFAGIGLWLAKYAAGRWLKDNWRLVLIALGVLAVLVGCWRAYSAIYDSGVTAERNRWEERQRAAEAKAQKDSWAIVFKFADIDLIVTTAKTETAKAEAKYVPVIQGAASVFYLANPNCRPPDKLWRANDQLARDLAAPADLSVGTLSGIEGAGQ